MKQLVLLLVVGIGSSAYGAIETFDNPVTTGASQAPGVWYTDRYAPAAFTSPEFFDGDNRLLQSISSADGANSRPGAYSSTFYNTQGRKFDLDPGTNSISIDLYIPADWADSGRRMAGFWGTAFDSGNQVSAYPIMEFTTDGSGARFRGWDGAGWTDMGLPIGFAYDAWYTLNIGLSGGNFAYNVGNLDLLVGAGTSENIGNVILQGYNTADGVTYDIHWDNLQASAVPEPASLLVWSMLGLALGGATWWRRKRSA